MKVAMEVAASEFERMCKAWRVVTDPDELSPEENAKLDELASKIIKRIMKGTLVVDADGRPTYTPPVQGAKPLTLKKLDGTVLISGGRKTGDMDKLVEMLAGMTERPPVEIGKLASPDLLFMGSLIALFLGAE